MSIDRQQLTEALASLTDAEVAEVIAEARGGGSADVKQLIEREIARLADAQPSLNSEGLERSLRQKLGVLEPEDGCTD
jgi:hypothetical protein